MKGDCMPCLHQVGAKSFCIFTFTCNQLIFVFIAQGKEKEKNGYRDSQVIDNSLLCVDLFSGCSKDAKRSCQAVDRLGFKSYKSQR